MSEPTFEEALTQLEALVAKLEAGELPLEEALRTFEEGVRLSRLCAARLEEVERRVHLLSRGADGTEQEVPFHAGSEGGGHE